MKYRKLQEIRFRVAIFWGFAMRLTLPASGRHDLFRERLDPMINMGHPLVKLSKVMDWSRFDVAFRGFYRPVGRPAKPTRLMVGLHYLKRVHDLSDEETVERWVENPTGSRTPSVIGQR